MSEQEFIIRKDALGYRLAPLIENDGEEGNYDGTMFTLENGEKVGKHQGWIAEPENLLAVQTGGKMKTPEELMIPSLKPDQIRKRLHQMGLCLDHDWRIRKFMREPFTKVKALHALPLIEMHKKVCEEAKKDPENVPLNIGWFDGALGMFVGPMPTMVPEMEGGQIVLYKDRMGHFQVVLKHGDWYAYPKDQRDDMPVCTLFLMKFMDRTQPSNFETMEELIGQDKFMTPEGILVGKGGFITLSIDDFLGPAPKEE
jgi:hypothetical protein